MAKGCALSTGCLPQGGLPRNSVDRITDRPDMTSAVDRGLKASTQTKNKLQSLFFDNANFIKCLGGYFKDQIESNSTNTVLAHITLTE